MKIYYNPKLTPLARELRKNSTLGEVLLWEQLKGRRMHDYQFMRQKPIGDYIVDFFCNKLKLIIEIDGKASHRFKLTEDAERERWLKDLGLAVLRFEEKEVRKDMKGVLHTIEHWILEQEG
jgi:very-short-patch-repair endonuclease